MSGQRLLVVGADPRTLALTASALRREGFAPVTTTRGEDALALLQTGFAAVFCDVQTPGLDGFTLCASARRAPLTQRTPFFLLSSSRADSAHRAQAFATGADDYLLKPLFVRDLSTLARLFAGQHRDAPHFGGELATTPLFFVLRALTSGVRSGTVTVASENAAIDFRDGAVVEARAGALRGDPAIARLLALPSGAFTLSFGAVAEGSMYFALRDLLTYEEPRRRRLDQILEMLGGQQARLGMYLPSLMEELPRLPPSLEKIVRLFDGERTLGEVFRASDLEAVTTAEIVVRLRLLGVLQPSSSLRASRFALPEPLPPLDVPASVPREIREWLEDFSRREHARLGTGSSSGDPQGSGGGRSC